jgi:transposase
MAWRGLTTQQWEAVRVPLPEPTVSPRGGRPHVADRRYVEGILWILWTGAPWSERPRRYGRPSPCWRRLKSWEDTGLVLKRWRAFLAHLNAQQQRRWDEGFAAGSVVPANQGGPGAARPTGARGRSGWCWSMARGRRWAQTWRRRPRQRSRSSQRRSTRAPSGAQGRPDGPANGPSGGWRIAALTAIRGAPAWPARGWSPACRRGGTIRTRPIKMGASCDGSGGGGSSSGRSPGWDPFAGWSCGMSG